MAEEPPGSSGLDFVQNVLKSVVSASKTGNSLPSIGNNYELLSSFPVFAKLMDVEGKRLLNMLSDILRHAGVKQTVASTTQDKDEILDKLIDANDALIERIGISLDEAAGIRKQPEPLVVSFSRKPQTISTSWNKNMGDALTRLQPDDGDKQIKLATVKLMAARNVVRPQAKFMDTIDNSSRPFVPKLKSKDNAKIVYQGNIKMFVDNEKMEGSGIPTDQAQATHPYQYELDHLEIDIVDRLVTRTPQMFRPLSETPLVFVTTEAGLAKLCEDLKKQNEFAVDLEHHNYRTFLGLTCLMQISTRETDYIVDTLELWRVLYRLNDPFTDPAILKVFHGADSDILWLQRDFGIYVVNMFDTGQAARILQLPRLGLGFLIKHYLDKDLEKQYQFADWRIRPLPTELINYAREDTHYLLYIYDLMSNSLLDMGNDQQNLLKAVYHRSRDLCLKQYEKPTWSETDYLRLYEKHKKTFNNRQLAALEQLYAWRDKLARLEDESLQYILPDHMMLQIAEVLPREMQGVLACCNPTPPMVKQELHYLHRMIVRARELPLETKVGGNQPVTFSRRQRNPLLHCQHDYTHMAEDEELAMQVDKPTCDISSVVVKTEPIIKLFSDSVKTAVHVHVNATSWISPYEQYLIAKEISEKEAEQRLAIAKAQRAAHPVKAATTSSSETKQPLLEVAEEKFSESPSDPLADTFRKKTRRGGKKKLEDDSPNDEVKLKKPKVQLSQVKPFDYGAVESSIEATTSKKKPKHFDPARDAKSGAKTKGIRRKKAAGRSDKKSVTYGSGKKHQSNLSHRSFPKT